MRRGRPRSPRSWKRRDGAVYRDPDGIWDRISSLASRISHISSDNRDSEALEEAAQEVLYFASLISRRGEYRYASLDDEILRVVKAALSGRFTKVTHLFRVLYPDEPAGESDKLATFLKEFNRIRQRALIEIPKVLANPDLEATLPDNEREFYDWLRKKFGRRTFIAVRDWLNQIGHGPETRERGDDLVLGRSKLRVMKALLFGNYRSELEACRSLWPEESRTMDSNSLVSRFSHNKTRGLEVMARVLSKKEFYSLGLPTEDVKFYERVLEEFGSDEPMRKVAEKAHHHASKFTPKHLASKTAVG